VDRRELYRYTGNEAQLFGVRRMLAQDGTGVGGAVYEAFTAGGLQLDVLPDTGLDIGYLRYRGINISFISKNGYDSPARWNPFENNFASTFPGGMLYTCGLRSVGPGNRDGGEWFPLHGHYHGIPASNSYALTDGDDIVIGGVVRETALFGHALKLTRKITIPAFGASVTIEDELENATPSPVEIMTLYHVNFGYPMISESARLILPERRRTTPRTEFARQGLGSECEFTKPLDGEEERVYFHEMSEQADAMAVLENPAIRVRAVVRWSLDTLPILGHWRSMASGDYVLGIEPSNCFVMGREAERKNGTLVRMEPFEKRRMRVALKFEDMQE
jgi:hypothetical protein